MTNELYESAIKIDKKTGLPADYISLVEGYMPLIRKAARRAGVPERDVEDAIQEVSGKFYAKNGLQMYDPTKNSKFSTLYYNWCYLFMLQERDKSSKYKSRFSLLETIPDDSCSDFLTETESDLETNLWLDRAQKVLISHDKSNLIPLLRECYQVARLGVKPTKKHYCAILGISIKKLDKMFSELRAELTSAGLGESYFVEQY